MTRKLTLSIDPGNELSAYCFLEGYKPVSIGKVGNSELLQIIAEHPHDVMAIEMIASYGMPVGSTIFDTCVWLGRFIERSTAPHHLVYRKNVKLNLCHTHRAKDSNVRQALLDRFGDVGTKKHPGWFYGFKSDIWSAYAVGITYLDSIGSDHV